MSETVSQLLEPVANNWKGGMEVNSTSDFISRVDDLNDRGEHAKLEDNSTLDTIEHRGLCPR